MKKNILSVKLKVFVNQQNSFVTYKEFFYFNQVEFAIIKNINIKNCTLIIIKTSKKFTNFNM